MSEVNLIIYATRLHSYIGGRPPFSRQNSYASPAQPKTRK